MNNALTKNKGRTGEGIKMNSIHVIRSKTFSWLSIICHDWLSLPRPAFTYLMLEFFLLSSIRLTCSFLGYFYPLKIPKILLIIFIQSLLCNVCKIFSYCFQPLTILITNNENIKLFNIFFVVFYILFSFFASYVYSYST